MGKTGCLSCGCPTREISPISLRDEEEEERWQPLMDRSCTDVIALVIFILFWVGMFFIAAYSIAGGNAYRLAYGTDSYGNVCGMQNVKNANINLKSAGLDMTGRPYVFFMDILNPKDALEICVSKCPDQDLNSIQELQEFAKNSSSSLCEYDVKQENMLTAGQSHLGPCPSTPVKASLWFQLVVFSPISKRSTSFLNRCVPKDAPEFLVKFMAILNSYDIFYKVLSDVFQARAEIAGMCVLAVVVALLMVALIRFVAGFVMWIFMGIVAVASIVGTALLWWTYASKNQEYYAVPENERLDENGKDVTAFLVYSIIATIATVVLLIVLFVMRKRVKLVVALFHEAGKVFMHTPLLVLQPLWTFIALALFFIYWIAVLVFLATAGEPTVDTLTGWVTYRDPEPVRYMWYKASGVSLKHQTSAHKRTQHTYREDIQCHWTKRLGVRIPPNVLRTFPGEPTVDTSTGWVTYKDPEPVRYMWWYHVVGLLWTSEFFLACQQMVIAGAVTQVYFTRDKKQVSSPILKATGRLISYHLGSVAVGSFIIVLVKIPRLILTYIQAKLKDKENSCVQFTLKCCMCCLWCLENCLKYLNYNAYTVIAIEGTSFCTAARRAFLALVSNALRVVAINSVGDFVLFLGKLGVVAVVGAISLIIFRTDARLHYYAVPILVICVFAFFIAHCFLSVYEMVVDTLLLCFCEDCRINDGSPGREYYMDKSLLEFVENSSEALKNLDKKKKKETANANANEHVELKETMNSSSKADYV
ncbi:choline transporter-like protein 1 [Branchiostoma lanceolatum]|uniref:choline transporter-like protein 1 n=1 Tax=Branchiostoma lanceolatum TaxID=7740 RepID=UPI0034549D35